MNDDRRQQGLVFEMGEIINKAEREVVNIDPTLNHEEIKAIVDAYVRFYIIDINTNALAGIVRASKKSKSGSEKWQKSILKKR